MAGFDPTHAVRFELPRGQVIAGDGERSVVLSCSVLDDLVLVAGTEAAGVVGRALGASIGRRIAARMGGARGVRIASLDEVVTEVAGELAVAGFGVASIERWGRALVVAVDRPAVRDLPFLASIVEGMLEGATDATVKCASLGRDGTMVRVLVASEDAAARAVALLDRGIPWGEVLVHLQARKDHP
jgi:hypothetical protein